MFIFNLILSDLTVLPYYFALELQVIAIVDQLFPECEHRMCARHILENWSQNFRGIERRKNIWAYSRPTFDAQFKHNINALSKLGTSIVEYLIKYNKRHGSKLFSKHFQSVIV